jgi:hypothetical protein
MTVTTTEYGNFQEAFDYFNNELFNGKLPPCLITLQRKKRTLGYYSPQRFKSRVNQGFTDEIALNPAGFEGQTDEQVLSTLVHEMVHQFQRLFGNPGRGRYHNREWAEFMIERGLIPIGPDGKQTGDRISHYIKKDGKFQKACQKLLATGFKLNWQSVEDWTHSRGKASQNGKEAEPKKDRQKFSCPSCGLNAWAKPSAILICGPCYMKAHYVQVMKNPAWDHDFESWTDDELAKLTLVNGG